MRYRLVHVTVYGYESDVSASQNEARLHPQDGSRQDCTDWTLACDPPPSFVAERLDAFGNTVHYLEFDTPHRRLEVRAESLVTTQAPPVRDPSASLRCARVRDLLAQGKADPTVRRFVHPSAYVPFLPGLAELATELSGERPVLEAALALCARIHREYRYVPGSTGIATPLSRVLSQRSGVCQDFAHLMVAVLRSAGLPARYASGYLETLPPPGKPRLVGADASHAWVSVWCPPYGWVDLDPTNDCVVGERHIVLGWGRDYGDVCPWKGLVLGGGRQTVAVSVDTAPLG